MRAHHNSCAPCLIMTAHACVFVRILACVCFCRWGSSFSNKFFLEKRFVVKHILNKHQEKLEEHKVGGTEICTALVIVVASTGPAPVGLWFVQHPPVMHLQVSAAGLEEIM